MKTTREPLKKKKQPVAKRTIGDIIKQSDLFAVRRQYDSTEATFNANKINNVIFDERKKITSQFKDYLLIDETAEFVSKYYSMKEISRRLPSYIRKQTEQNLVFPIYFAIEPLKEMNKLVRKKNRFLRRKLENANISDASVFSNILNETLLCGIVLNKQNSFISKKLLCFQQLYNEKGNCSLIKNTSKSFDMSFSKTYEFNDNCQSFSKFIADKKLKIGALNSTVRAKTALANPIRDLEVKKSPKKMTMGRNDGSKAAVKLRVDNFLDKEINQPPTTERNLSSSVKDEILKKLQKTKQLMQSVSKKISKNTSRQRKTPVDQKGTNLESELRKLKDANILKKKPLQHLVATYNKKQRPTNSQTPAILNGSSSASNKNEGNMLFRKPNTPLPAASLRESKADGGSVYNIHVNFNMRVSVKMPEKKPQINKKQFPLTSAVMATRKIKKENEANKEPMTERVKEADKMTKLGKTIRMTKKPSIVPKQASKVLDEKIKNVVKRPESKIEGSKSVKKKDFGKFLDGKRSKTNLGGKVIKI